MTASRSRSFYGRSLQQPGAALQREDYCADADCWADEEPAPDEPGEPEFAEVADDGEGEEIVELLDDRPVQVQDGLYIGSYMAEMNKPALRKAGITDILQVAQGLFPHHPLIFNYMNIQVQDLPTEDLVRWFPKCFDFIDAAISRGGKVLVHCAAGVSRSATVVLGFLMSRYNMELAAALDHLKAVRPWVCPNSGFLKQLEAYQELSHDMSRWRAWHTVCAEQQARAPAAGQPPAGEQQQQPQPQLQWLSIPQVHGRPPAARGHRHGSQHQQQQQQPCTEQQQPQCAQVHHVPIAGGTLSGGLHAGLVNGLTLSSSAPAACSCSGGGHLLPHHAPCLTTSTSCGPTITCCSRDSCAVGGGGGSGEDAASQRAQSVPGSLTTALSAPAATGGAAPGQQQSAKRSCLHHHQCSAGSTPGAALAAGPAAANQGTQRAARRRVAFATDGDEPHTQQQHPQRRQQQQLLGTGDESDVEMGEAADADATPSFCGAGI